MTIRFLTGLLILLVCGGAAAQITTSQDRDRQYVTDQLRLSLYSNANAQSQVIKLLQSGDLLEIEQISGPYALVVTSDGTRGWVKRGFLVTKPTSNLLLREEQQKTEALEAEIEKLANSKVVIDQYEQDMNSMAEKMDALEAENQQANADIAELEAAIEAKQLEIDRRASDSIPASEVLIDTFMRYWQYVVPLLLVVVFISFLISKEIIESRIKSKFHGIKIW